MQPRKSRAAAHGQLESIATALPLSSALHGGVRGLGAQDVTLPPKKPFSLWRSTELQSSLGLRCVRWQGARVLTCLCWRRPPKQLGLRAEGEATADLSLPLLRKEEYHPAAWEQR